MYWLDYFIIATYIAQIYQICFFAVPSAGSTAEMLMNRKRKKQFNRWHPGTASVHSTLQMVGISCITMAVLTVSMIPMLTVLFPPVTRYLLPFTQIPPSTGLSVISAVLLLLGNILTYIAVATLRAHVSFHEFGETTRLYTAGIYSVVRNPITLGLSLIFSGFVLARPSVVMLFGWIIFVLNSHYRIQMEEVYLEKTFGSDFRQYKSTVGKYVPKLGRHTIAKSGPIKEGEIKPQSGDTVQE